MDVQDEKGAIQKPRSAGRGWLLGVFSLSAVLLGAIQAQLSHFFRDYISKATSAPICIHNTSRLRVE
jgi:hypothetical protein